jgi:peptidoglycan hydrolase CwlO-like protein
MTIHWKILASGGVLAIALMGYVFSSKIVYAAENCDQITCDKGSQDDSQFLDCSKRKQTCWEEKIRETQNAATSLSNTITLLNGKINLQQVQIEQTLGEISQLEKEISQLSTRIAGLNISLDRLGAVLVKRVQEQYKRSNVSPMLAFISGDNFTHSLTQLRYVSLAQEQTAKTMQQAEEQKQTYDEQKNLKEQKQKEVEQKKVVLEGQRKLLAQQRADQQQLLTQTKNDEARYQSELAKTLAEAQAIQDIIAGKGSETKVNDVKEGDKIASIILGSSACSNGTHLHFEVVKDGRYSNPAQHLKSISAAWNNGPADGPFDFSGNWNWPVENPAKINQGFGMTSWARTGYYNGGPHTGIDMASKDANYTVKAVKDGTLYRGSVTCGGRQLRYVRVEHKDEGYNTYYLHVNY